jgi:formate dehydrogenase maturation protein FdhE
MTEQQKKEYLEDPDKCPYCKSEDVAGEFPDFGESYAMRNVSCNQCNKNWTDYYVLTDVLDIKQ